MYYFIYNGHNTFTTTVPSFIIGNFLCFIESQFTTNIQVSSTWINARMDTSDHNSRALSKVPGRLWVFRQA